MERRGGSQYGLISLSLCVFSWSRREDAGWRRRRAGQEKEREESAT